MAITDKPVVMAAAVAMVASAKQVKMIVCAKPVKMVELRSTCQSLS
jgi:hypothetical protein